MLEAGDCPEKSVWGFKGGAIGFYSDEVLYEVLEGMSYECAGLDWPYFVPTPYVKDNGSSTVGWSGYFKNVGDEFKHKVPERFRGHAFCEV